ncbi:MAG TPA: lysylphosphatidylglycerol synthase transmembrane domain-containing protein [Terriglobia bacterium]|nr:lysylphosphatidylglycerol synthase transmembrane domain-containing protein [Terriglobia bacterium]
MLNNSFSRQHSKWRTLLTSLLIYIVSLGCLIWVLTGINWNELWGELSHADIRWIIMAGSFEFGNDVYHAWRWNLLLRPVSHLKLWRTVRALYVGLFTNEILPLRPGEVIRSYLLAGWNRMAFSLVISSVALERLLDGFSLVVALSFTAVFVSLPAYLVTGARLMAAFLILAACLLLFLLWRIRDRASLPRWMHRFGAAIEGIRLMANARTLAICAIASVVQLGLQAFPYWALSKSCRLDLSVWALIAVLIVVRTATAIPSAPGNAGLLQVACVLALGLFGIDKTLATGFAALLFLVLAVPLLLGGAVVVAFTGVSIRGLRRSMVEISTTHSRSGRSRRS